MGDKIEVTYKGIAYIFDSRLWYEAKTFQTPPSTVINELEKIAGSKVKYEWEDIDDCHQLLKIASKKAFQEKHKEVVKITKRILSLNFNCNRTQTEMAASKLCASLRALSKPQDALLETEKYKKHSSGYLLISRAAALCDLQRWDEAEAVINRVDGRIAYSVKRRIQKERPK